MKQKDSLALVACVVSACAVGVSPQTAWSAPRNPAAISIPIMNRYQFAHAQLEQIEREYSAACQRELERHRGLCGGNIASNYPRSQRFAVIDNSTLYAQNRMWDEYLEARDRSFAVVDETVGALFAEQGSFAGLDHLLSSRDATVARMNQTRLSCATQAANIGEGAKTLIRRLRS